MLIQTSENSLEDEKDLISELKVLRHVGAHPNIVSFLGAAVHEGMWFLSALVVSPSGGTWPYLGGPSSSSLSQEGLIQTTPSSFPHTGNLHVIVEFCGKGSLLHYLRSKRMDRRCPLTPRDQLVMAHQVAQGMCHLASKKVSEV